VRSDESPGERGERALLEITDDGAGMDAATLERVFDPFFSTKFTGRGLGLPTAQGITRALGGAIEVESEPGRGTSVRITFPVSQRADIAAEAPVAVLPTPSAAGARRAPRDGLILIVDDDSNVRQAIARMFKRLGREVLLAADGAEALGLVDTRADEIGAVLLDLSMPGEGGWKVLAAMRRRAPDHYIVIASGFDVAQLRDEDRALAPDAWLQKPFGLREVAELFAPR
jgi:CheY-like chemotaxis protein